MKDESLQKKIVKAKIMSNKRLSEEHFQIQMNCPYIARNILPGQFIQIRLNMLSRDPLLCRPFAVYQADDDLIEIFFKLVGKGTYLLSNKIAGETLEITGPLGNGFPIDCTFDTALLVAGGMGIAGLYHLAKKFIDKKIIFLLGACSEDRLLGIDDLVSSGICMLTATEDGSCGYRGMVTQLLDKVISDGQMNSNNCRIYSCGPMPMMKAVSEIAYKHNIRAYVSLEERMACGLGACMGCAVEVKSRDSKTEYKMVCSDGPVFDSQEIIWK